VQIANNRRSLTTTRHEATRSGGAPPELVSERTNELETLSVATFVVVARAVVVEIRALEPLRVNISYRGQRFRRGRHDLRGMCGREPRKARGLAAVLRNLEREGEHQQPL
jgi:hypothetical protein